MQFSLLRLNFDPNFVIILIVRVFSLAVVIDIVLLDQSLVYNVNCPLIVNSVQL